MRRRSRAKHPLFALLAATLALSLLYLVCEFAVFPLLLPRLSHRLRWRLNFPETVLAQSTKRGRLPKDYIALFGDSYAVGLGDEWESLDRSSSEPFASAGLLFSGLGRDVVTFGRSGAGDITGWLAAPAAVLSYLDGTLLYRLERPRVILAYFYEGNDLRENNRELRRYESRLPASDRAEALRILAASDHPLLQEAPPSRRANFVFAGFAKSVFRKLFEWSSAPKPLEKGESPAPETPTHSRDVRTSNRVLVAGRELPIPGRLQGPDTGLGEAETQGGLFVMRLSLEALRRAFPDARVVVVYIPSPLSCYRLLGPADTEDQGALRRVPPALIARRSDLIARGVETAARELGMEFLDTRPSVREAAARLLVHGPFDWRHFNRHGYAAMTRPVIRLLRETAESR